MRALHLMSAALLLAGCSGSTQNGPKTSDPEQEPIVYEDMPGGEQPAEDPADEPPVEEPPAPAVPPDLHGTWSGACVATSGGEHKKLRFEITAERWDMRYELFNDAACTRRKLSLHVAGPYQVLDASASTPGAWNATFGFDTRELTADDAKTAKSLGKLCGIKMKAKKASDIHAKGCPKFGLQPADACPGDHDLVAVDRDRLYFGVRPEDNNLCTEDRRPAALIDPESAFAFEWPTIGIAECDAYVASARGWIGCDAVPSDAARAMFDGVRTTAEQFAQMAAGGERNEELASNCKAGDDATKDALAAAGCS